MLHAIVTWFLVAGFFGAGLFNAITTRATQDSFVRWGFPNWWCRVTGASEIAIAVLLAFPGTHATGLALGALVVVSACFVVVRHREFAHLAPLGLFAALLVLSAGAR